MHRARVTLSLMTTMNEDELEQWTLELTEEARLHLTEGEAVALDHFEVEASSVK